MRSRSVKTFSIQSGLDLVILADEVYVRDSRMHEAMWHRLGKLPSQNASPVVLGSMISAVSVALWEFWFIG